jgi:hypothetical protein
LLFDVSFFAVAVAVAVAVATLVKAVLTDIAVGVVGGPRMA